MQCSGVPVSLSEGGWEELASRTEGQSGSDVATLVADALMQPVRELEQATHWKPSLGTEGLFSPCPPSDPLAQELSLLDLLPTQVHGFSYRNSGIGQLHVTYTVWRLVFSCKSEHCISINLI